MIRFVTWTGELLRSGSAHRRRSKETNLGRTEHDTSVDLDEHEEPRKDGKIGEQDRNKR